MKSLKISHGGIVSLVAFFIFLTGCDKIPFFKEYFAPKTNQTAAAPAVKGPAPAPQIAVPAPQPAVSPSDKPLADNELARVGDWSITIEEFNERLKRLKEVVPDFNPSDLETKKTILDELIRQQLLVTDAEKNGVSNSKDIKDALEEFRRTLLVREVANKITKDITVTEQEAEDYYNKNKEALAEPTQWHVREIVTNTEAGAKEILTALYGGGDFAQTAKDRSIGKTAANGGDLGFITETPFPQMQNALMALEVGGISSVLKGPDEKFYIVKLEEKHDGKVQEFPVLKDEIIKGLTLLKQQQVIVDYLNQLAAKIPTKVNEKLLGK